MPKIKKIVISLSVFFLAFELPLIQISGSGFKLWMLSALAGGLILVWDLYHEGWGWLKKSKLFWLGVGLLFFSGLGLFNSPLKGYSLKQLVILAAIIILAVFFEKYLRKYNREVIIGLVIGISVSSFYAIYQNIAFNFGWPSFEIMEARPNGFFPEPDWLGIYLALGLVPFLALFGEDKKNKSFQRKLWIYCFLTLGVLVLIITVARASWLALIAEIGVASLTLTYIKSKKLQDMGFGLVKNGLTFISLIVLSLIIVNLFHLSRFNITDRFRSIFFKEHIITEAFNSSAGEKIKINLEEIEVYRAQGYQIQENYVGDENVASREEKFASTWDIIKAHPLLGSGLGITLINTNYQHNANNLYLEWWASAGLGGLILIVGFLVCLIVKGLALLRDKDPRAVIVLAGTIGFGIVNIFNAANFLAFAWFYLAYLATLIQNPVEKSTK